MLHSNILRVNVAYTDAMTVVVVEGEIDMETAPTLRVALDQLEPYQPVYIDMADVSFIDSRGIRVLVGHAARMHENGKGFHLRNPSPVVRKTIEIAGLSEQFCVDAS